MIEYPDVARVRLSLVPATSTVVAQTTHCRLKEEPVGVIMNVDTGTPFAHSDRCVGRNPHIAYSAATQATQTAVKMCSRKCSR